MKKKEAFDIGHKRTLQSPYITEKATAISKENKYIFKVWPEANKTEVKKSIEKKYNVDVESIKVINVKRKKRRLGKHMGWKKGFKKAIIEVKEGQKIEILSK